jgi:MFS family permease
MAWRMVAVAFTVGFVVFGVLYSFGVLLEPVASDLQVSVSAASLLYAISSSAFYFLGPVTGRLGDRLGPRALTAVGAAVMGLGLVATAFAPDLATACVTYGLGVGIGSGCAYIPTLANLGSWFERQRTKALGIAAAGTGCGMLAVPPLVAVLTAALGWRGAVAAVGVGSAITLAVCALAVHAPPQAKAAVATEPRTAIRSRPFLLLYVSWVLGTMALFVPIVFLPAFAAAQGAGPVAASALVSILGGASIAGRLGIGYVADKIGTMRIYKLSVLAMALSYGLWLALPAYAWLAVFAAVLGLAYGVRIALVAPVLIELFGSRNLGALLGAFFTATGIAGLLGPLAAGLAVDASGSHAGGIVAAIIMGSLGYVVIAALRPVRQ